MSNYEYNKKYAKEWNENNTKTIETQRKTKKTFTPDADPGEREGIK